MDEIDVARKRLIEAGRVLEHQGHGDMTRGHVSIRVPGVPGQFLMKPHSVGFDEITLDNMLTFDLEGVVVAGTARPHSECFIHSEIFRARPDVNAVIHTHPTWTTALSVSGQTMRAINQGGAIFAGHLPVFDETMDLIRNQAMGRRVAACLGPHHAVLMRSHGVTLAGETIEQAVVLAVMLEEASRIQLLAAAAGADSWEFPAEDVARLRGNLMRPDQFVVNFEYLVRKVGRASF